MRSSAGAEQIPRLRLRVTSAAQSILRFGHPWLFAESIREQNREGHLGELGVVYDGNNRFLAAGLFDPQSAIRLRILQYGKPQLLDSAWWRRRLTQPLERRQGLFDQQTTGFRWINGESDGWPALVLDGYGENMVLKLYSAIWLPRLADVVGMLVSELKPSRLVLRLSRNIQAFAEREFQHRDGDILHGSGLEGPVVFKENGLLFESDILKGQKTGFFLDQRENRSRVGKLAEGRRMLNAFSFSGGFSLYAARGGARQTTDLDISAHALASARRNFDLNRPSGVLGSCLHEQLQVDAFSFLATPDTRTFDLIVLDPPSLAKRETERAGAIRAYQRLVRGAILRLDPAGVLVACSCSAHVNTEEFFDAVQSAGMACGRKCNVLEKTGHVADHPATFKEANYLKAIYLRVD